MALQYIGSTCINKTDIEPQSYSAWWVHPDQCWQQHSSGPVTASHTFSDIPMGSATADRLGVSNQQWYHKSYAYMPGRLYVASYIHSSVAGGYHRSHQRLPPSWGQQCPAGRPTLQSQSGHSAWRPPPTRHHPHAGSSCRSLLTHGSSPSRTNSHVILFRQLKSLTPSVPVEWLLSYLETSSHLVVNPQKLRQESASIYKQCFEQCCMSVAEVRTVHRLHTQNRRVNLLPVLAHKLLWGEGSRTHTLTFISHKDARHVCNSHVG